MNFIIDFIKGIAFIGDNESQDSYNKGNFLELISLRSNQLPILKEDRRCAYQSPDAQNEIINFASLASQVKQFIS